MRKLSQKDSIEIVSASDTVDTLIADCKAIVDYYVDNVKLPGNGRKVVRDAMYARVTRLTFSGFGPRLPFRWAGVRKK
jgi:hypothetical protein